MVSLIYFKKCVRVFLRELVCENNQLMGFTCLGTEAFPKECSRSSQEVPGSRAAWVSRNIDRTSKRPSGKGMGTDLRGPGLRAWPPPPRGE